MALPNSINGALISQRLIRKKGFKGIAVEGEWADSYRVNEFVHGPQHDSIQALALLRQYDRWPTWMWGNTEVAGLVTWMNHYNQGRPAAQQAGFYGLDVYCLWESNQELMSRLQSNDSLLRLSAAVQQCFQPFSADPIACANAVASVGANCRQQAAALYNGVMQGTYSGTVIASDGVSRSRPKEYRLRRSAAGNRCCMQPVRATS
jgi:erythromycin esterase